MLNGILLSKKEQAMERYFVKYFPRIGLRIVKSAVAVFICFLVYKFFRKNGLMFYSQLAVLWCIQPQRGNMISNVWQRTIGTFVGAFFGLIVLLVDGNIFEKIFSYGSNLWELIYAIFVSLLIVAVIYTTLIIKRRNASYFSCVVFLSIVVNHIGDANPYLFVFDRVVDTMIGIGIAIFVNNFQLPRRKEKDILFVSGIDDTLIGTENVLSPYSLVELNRMIEEGANFTVSTMRTPASLMEPLKNVNLKLPVIAMNGAVMYDIKKHEYIKMYVISQETKKNICDFLDGFDCNYFINEILENVLFIRYKELMNDAEKDVYKKLSISPYRNYTTKDLGNLSQCIYFMIITQKQNANDIYASLVKEDFAGQLRIMMYDSTDYKGYSYIKIYNKNATRDNMINYLKNDTGLKKTVTFGSIPGKYDVVVQDSDYNCVAKTLKEMYEPLIWKKKL